MHDAYGEGSPSRLVASLNARAVRPVQSAFLSPTPSSAESLRRRDAQTSAPAPQLGFNRSCVTLRPRSLEILNNQRMDVTIKRQPELRVGTVRHIGPYERIVHAFERLGAMMAGAKRPPNGQLLALYYDDPQTTPADRLRADAALSFPPGVDVPPGLIERCVAAGKYATAIYVGAYDGLPRAWADLKEEMQTRRLTPTGAVSYELYLNDPMRVSAGELKTELCVPIE